MTYQYEMTEEEEAEADRRRIERDEEREILEKIAERGFSVDEGNLIGGPFIPDGRIRIVDSECSEKASGKTLKDAYEDLCFIHGKG